MPIGSKGLGESGLKVVQSVEDRVGEDPAQRLEPAFRRVEFGAVGRQGDLLNAVGPADLPLVWLPLLSSTSPILSEPVCCALLQEALEAEPVDVRQEQHEGSAHRLDRGIEPEPMVLMLMDPGRAAAERAPQPAVCHLQTEPGMAPIRRMTRCTASRDTVVSSFFKGRLLGGAGLR